MFKSTTAFVSGSKRNISGDHKCLSLSLFFSDLNESERWRQLFQKLFNCKSTSLPPGKSGDVIHVLNHGNTQVELVGNSIYSRVRNFIGHPPFTHLLNVSTNAVGGTGSSSKIYYPSLASALRKVQTGQQTQFVGGLRSPSSSSSSLKKDSLVRGVKEIIVPSTSSFSHADKLEQELEAKAVEALVNVYEVNMGAVLDKVYLRTAPTERCQVVLKVDNLNNAMERLNGLDIIFEKIGANGMTSNAGGGQIKLRTSASSFGELDLRLTDSNAQPAPFFVEGEESVLQGAILGLQNPRVLGGDATATFLSQSSPRKDCWMEVRAMIRS